MILALMSLAAAAEPTALDRPASERPASERPASERPAAEGPAAEGPAAGRSSRPAITVGWGTGVDARLGKGAVFVGAGGGPTVEVALSEHLDAHAEVRWLTLAGSTWLVRGGVGARLVVGAWRPGVGLDATGYLGATLRAVTVENPDLAPDSALALQLRLDPLRFEKGRWRAEALRIEIGAGWDRGAPALAFGVTLAEAGIRF